MKAAVVIATLFEPPTLGPLVDTCKAQGADVFVIHGQPTNAAWNEGIRKTEADFVVIANDDIEVVPQATFLDKLARHHRAGYTHVTATMWRSLNIVMPDGTCVSKGKPAQNGASRVEAEPMDKGHLFSMDLAANIPLVPSNLTIFYGDDWFFWQHRTKGRCCIALDVQVKSGGDLPEHEGFDGLSGWTCRHPNLTGLLGEPIEEIEKREHVIADDYFLFYADEHGTRFRNSKGWKGMSCGLRGRRMHFDNRGTLEKYIEGVGADDNSYFNGYYTGGYYIQQRPDEAADYLWWMMGHHPRIESYLEVGVAAGGNLRLTCDVLHVGDVTVVDDARHRNNKHFQRNVAASRFSGTFKPYWGDSHSAEAKAFLRGCGRTFDVAFVDGDHEQAGVQQDVDLVAPLVREGGLLILHDVVCAPGVKVVYDGLVKSKAHGLDHMLTFKADQRLQPLGIGIFRKRETA
jgi:predicted O-methyltransferase YrrM